MILTTLDIIHLNVQEMLDTLFKYPKKFKYNYNIIVNAENIVIITFMTKYNDYVFCGKCKYALIVACTIFCEQPTEQCIIG